LTQSGRSLSPGISDKRIPVNIPNLPTDNLYKFLALSGVALALFSIYYQLSPIDTIVQKQLAVKTEIAVLRANAEANGELVELIGEIIDNTIARQQDTYEPNPNKIELSYSDEEIKELQARVREANVQIASDIARAERSNAQLEYLGKRQEVANTDARMMRIFATLLLSGGFGLWYWKVQRPLDLLLQGDVDARKMKAGSAAAPDPE